MMLLASVQGLGRGLNIQRLELGMSAQEETNYDLNAAYNPSSRIQRRCKEAK